jgi:hypothetical protein
MSVGSSSRRGRTKPVRRHWSGCERWRKPVHADLALPCGALGYLRDRLSRSWDDSASLPDTLQIPRPLAQGHQVSQSRKSKSPPSGFFCSEAVQIIPAKSRFLTGLSDRFGMTKILCGSFRPIRNDRVFLGGRCDFTLWRLWCAFERWRLLWFSRCFFLLWRGRGWCRLPGRRSVCWGAGSGGRRGARHAHTAT